MCVRGVGGAERMRWSRLWNETVKGLQKAETCEGETKLLNIAPLICDAVAEPRASLLP